MIDTLPATFVSQTELAWLTEHARGKKLVVDYGSYIGDSAIALAKSGAEVLAVDDFYGPRDQSMSPEQRALIYGVFIKRTQDFPNIHVNRIEHAFFHAPRECDMAFIDGDHSYESVKRDIDKFLDLHPCLLCGHDYSSWPTVRQVVDEMLPHARVALNNIWYIEL